MKLADIHLHYDTDKGTEHSYIDIYDTLFGPYQHQDINFLEVGALTCGSLKMFHSYFANANIYGIDDWSQKNDQFGNTLESKGIDLVQLVQDVARRYPRIHLRTCNSTDAAQVRSKIGQIKFDVIVDDGDHHPHSQFKTFENLWPTLKPHTGLYVIEDVMDTHYLCNLLSEYAQKNNLSISINPYNLLKNGRGDDNLVVVIPQRTVMEHFYQSCTPQMDYQDLYLNMINQAPPVAHFVEVGSWKGGSAAYMCVEIANSGKNIVFDCVDTWLGNDCHQLGQKYEDFDVVKGNLFDRFKLNMIPAIGLFRIQRGPSVDVSQKYQDKSLDFVFLDADHSYDGVKSDIAAWLPKVKPGGYIGGHDYGNAEWVGVQQAVDEIFPDTLKVPPACWLHRVQ